MYVRCQANLCVCFNSLQNKGSSSSSNDTQCTNSLQVFILCIYIFCSPLRCIYIYISFFLVFKYHFDRCLKFNRPRTNFIYFYSYFAQFFFSSLFFVCLSFFVRFDSFSLEPRELHTATRILAHM